MYRIILASSAHDALKNLVNNYKKGVKYLIQAKMLHKILLFILILPKSIFFNFHYLPLKQAIKLPILLFNVKLKSMKGKVIIDNPSIKLGMIRLGPKTNSLYETSNGKFVWEHRGQCSFKGTCTIGHLSAISTGKNAYLEFGDNFLATTSLRIACYKSITFGDNTLFSWENIVMDTDFHELINSVTGNRSIMSKEIYLGKNNWIGTRTIILKGTVIPDYSTVGANSLLNKKYEVPPYSLIAGNPAKLIKTGIYRALDSHVE